MAGRSTKPPGGVGDQVARDRASCARRLVAAGREAWEALRRAEQPGLIDRSKVTDGYVAGKLLERWLSHCAANRR